MVIKPWLLEVLFSLPTLLKSSKSKESTYTTDLILIFDLFLEISIKPFNKEMTSTFTKMQQSSKRKIDSD